MIRYGAPLNLFTSIPPLQFHDQVRCSSKPLHLCIWSCLANTALVTSTTKTCPSHIVPSHVVQKLITSPEILPQPHLPSKYSIHLYVI
ncbi:hypothetical protein PanWU01x14_254620 [Parasponia andersonii]|uniref:Uncharacterized protein n=1 Tax=Parasponia andersonii TaxID=3476 RepID=A0A2P5BB59_PARAD|nr:hypothetical protein PanWU01x14_254620 [Parasponia andersonii]